MVVLALGAALIGVACLTWDEIWDWFSENTTDYSSYGVMIKERLASGDFRVVTGIFDHEDEVETAQGWETDELDEELEELFDRSNEIIIDL